MDAIITHVKLLYSCPNTERVIVSTWENGGGDIAFKIPGGYIKLKASSSAGETFGEVDPNLDILLRLDTHNNTLKYVEATNKTSFGGIGYKEQQGNTNGNLPKVQQIADEDGDYHKVYLAPPALLKKVLTLGKNYCTEDKLPYEIVGTLDDSFVLENKPRLVPLKYGLAYFINVGKPSEPIIIDNENPSGTTKSTKK